jgi:6-phosphogluconolactonase/glucosamine-6-phosphate isomerase/deaminase
MPAERFHLGGVGIAGAEVLVGADPEEAARIAAGQFTALARNLVGEGKRVHVALSGGNSPRPLYQLLATEPFRQLVPWDAVHFFWGDERNVPPTDANSNYAMARELLLSHLSVPATHIHRIPTGDGTAGRVWTTTCWVSERTDTPPRSSHTGPRCTSSSAWWWQTT